MDISLDNLKLVGSSSRQANLDDPLIGQHVEGPAFRLAGWVVSNCELLDEIRFMSGTREIAKFGLGPRADVENIFQHEAGCFSYGFDDLFNALSLPDSFQITAWGVSKADVPVMLFFLSGARHPNNCELALPDPSFIVSMGRSGSSYLMELLSQNADIAVIGRHPKEFMHANWLAKEVFSKCLTAPTVCGAAGEFGVISPFVSKEYFSIDEIVNYVNRAFRVMSEASISHLASIYKIRSSDKARPVVLEKSNANYFINVISSVYPNSKFVFLLRHPADIFLSRWRFRKAIGNDTFGFENGRRDEIGILDLANDCIELELAIKNIPNHRQMIIKYELLMEKTDFELNRIAEFLNIAPFALDSKLIHPDNSKFNSLHITSYPVGCSSWNAEMPDDILEMLSITCSNFLKTFEYYI